MVLNGYVFDLAKETTAKVQVKRENKDYSLIFENSGTQIQGQNLKYSVVGNDVVIETIDKVQVKEFYVNALIDIDGNGYEEYRYEVNADGRLVCEDLDETEYWELKEDEILQNKVGGKTIKSLKAISVSGDGSRTDITAKLIEAAVPHGTSYSTFLSEHNDVVSINGSLTLEGYAKKDINAPIYLNGDEIPLNEILEFNVLPNNKGEFKGSYLNEFAVGTSADETFKMGAGYNEIFEIKGSGTDTVILTKDELLNIKGMRHADLKIVGNDVVATRYNNYELTITFDEDFVYGDVNYKKGTYTAHLAEYAGPNAIPGTIMWKLDSNYSYNDSEYGLYLTVSAGEFANRKVEVYGTECDFHITRYYGNGKSEIVTAWHDEQTLFNYQEDLSKVIIKDYVKEQIADVTVGHRNLEDVLYVAEMDETKTSFKGTRLGEKFDASRFGYVKNEETGNIEPDSEFKGVTINAGDGNNVIIGSREADIVVAGAGRDFVVDTKGNDTYTLGAGENTIVKYVYESGHDTVKLSAEEDLNVLFKRENHEQAPVQLIRKGDDIVAFASRNYMMKVTLTSNFELFNGTEPIQLTAGTDCYLTLGTGANGLEWQYLVPKEGTETAEMVPAKYVTPDQVVHTGFTIDKFHWTDDFYTEDRNRLEITIGDESVPVGKYTILKRVNGGRWEKADLSQIDDIWYTDQDEHINEGAFEEYFADRVYCSSVTFENAAKKYQGTSNVEVNGQNIFNQPYFIFPDEKGKLAGSMLNEIFNARFVAPELGTTINTGDGYFNVVYGSDGDDKVVGGSGHDVVYASQGDDTYTLGAGLRQVGIDDNGEPIIVPTTNKIFYSVGGQAGNDTVILSKGEVIDIVGFFVDDDIVTGDDLDPSKVEYYVDGKDVVLYRENGDTLTLKGLANKDLGATVKLNGHELVLGMDTSDIKWNKNYSKGTVTGTQADDYINLSDIPYYQDLKVNVNAGAGDNTIETGKSGVYTIKAGAGADEITVQGTSSSTIKAGDGENKVHLRSIGTNKVTTGKDFDTVGILLGNNTVNTGKGDGKFTIYGGTNKITTGKADVKADLLADVPVYDFNNYFEISGGMNTIKSTKSANEFVVNGSYLGQSNNTITTGKYDDLFFINDGLNTINAGAGNNKFDIDAGSNTITTGKGKDTFNIEGGDNTIKSGAGDDIFTITDSFGMTSIDAGAGNDQFTVKYTTTPTGDTTAPTVLLNGGKGDDKYDLTSAKLDEYQIVISDTKGDDTVLLDSYTGYNAFFDVTIKTNKKGEITKISTGSDLILTKGDELNAGLLIENGLSKKGVCSIEHFGEKSVQATTVNAIKESVAQWLASDANTTGYTSALEIFTNCHDADILNGLAGAYTNAQTCTQTVADIFGNKAS